MEDKEVDISDIPSNDPTDDFYNEIFGDAYVCTHTHICNPPGPDSTHTHTCYHLHTKILPAAAVVGGDDISLTDTAGSSKKEGKKRPSGNRKAVRKYREKKKAQAASLKEEVVELRALNQELMKRVRSKARLEAEVARLKCLLVDIRGRVEGEIGLFPHQKWPATR